MRLAPFESLLNRNIAASSTARSLCKRLDTKVLALHMEGLPFNICFRALGERMILETTTEAAADATVSGTALALARLAGPAPATALRTGAVHIEGDAEVAQTFSELLQHARPDLEEELSRIAGDVVAHRIGNLARSALGVARRVSGTFLQNVSEYLQEEGRDVPSRTEADEFLRAVDRLRDDVDRLEARLGLLESRHRK